MKATHVRRRENHSWMMFVRRTVSAQLHALGSVMMIAGAWYLLPMARAAGPEHYWACLSFMATGFLVFTASAVYHFLGDGFELSPQLHHALENMDHFGIYLFIAGTYTPFILKAVAPAWQVPLLFTIWVIAILGITYTSIKPWLPRWLQHRAVYTTIFVAMGWTAIIRVGDFFYLSREPLFFLVAGGLAYTVGAVVYATQRPRLLEGIFGYHEIWHVMVLLGAGSHYLLILSFYW